MTNYYVDSSASADGDGSASNPWNQIDAHVDALSGGDEMLLVGGSVSASRRSYTESGAITPTVSGSSSSPIIIRNNTDEYVEILSPGANTTLIDLDTVNYWSIIGQTSGSDYLFKIDGEDNGATRLIEINTATNITLDTLEVTQGNGDQIVRLAAASSITIQDCKMYDGFAGASVGVNGVQIVQACDGATISRCVFGDFAGDGIHIGGDVSTLPDELNVVVEDSEFYIGVLLAASCGEGGITNKNGASSIVRSCCFHGFRDCTGDCGGTGNRGNAIRFTDHASAMVVKDCIFTDMSGTPARADRDDMEFYGNLVYGMVEEAAADEFMVHVRGNGNRHQYYNNTFVGQHGTAGDLVKTFGSVTLDLFNNVFDATASTNDFDTGETINYDQNAWGSGACNLFSASGDVVAADLGFVDESINNYGPASSAVIINAGRVKSPYTDGYSGSAPDIGAFEFSNTSVAYKLDTFLQSQATARTFILDTVLQATGTKTYILQSTLTAATTMNTAKVRLSACTAAETQDFTFSGFGTPKAALFVTSYAVTNGASAQHMGLSYGAGTASDQQWAYHVNAEDSVGTTDVQARSSSALVITLTEPGNSTACAEANFNSFITDGVRIEWTTAPSSAFLVDVYLFGGTSLSAHADYFNVGNSNNNTVSVSDPQFEPNVLFTAIQDSALMEINPTNIRASYGLVHNDGAGTVTQRAFGIRTDSGDAATNMRGRASESFGIVTVTGTGGQDWGGTFEAFAASGFDLTTTGAGNNSDLMYLALGGIAACTKVVTVDTPTSTGCATVNTFGFRPQLTYQVATLMEAIDTAYNGDARAGGWALGGFNSASGAMTSIADEEAAATTDSQTLSENKAVNLPLDTGATGVEADFEETTASGYILDYTAVTGTAKKFFVLGFAVNITTNTANYVLDSVLKATDTKTHVLDAILKATTTKAYVLQTGLKATTTKAYTLDATLKAEAQTKAFTLQAILQATATKTYSLDAILKATATKAFVLQATLEASIVTDTRIYTLGAILKTTTTKAYSLDAVLKAEAVTRAYTLQAGLQKTDTRVYSLQSVLKTTTTATHILDSVLKATTTKTFILQANLKKTDTRAHVLDAILKAEAVTRTYILQAALSGSRQYLLGAILKAEAQTVSHSLDAILQTTATETYTLDSILKAEATAQTYTLDATLKTEAATRTYSLDSILKAESQTKVHTLDAILKAEAQAETYSLDATLKAGAQTKTFSLQAILLSTQTKTYSLDSMLKATATETYNLSSTLKSEANSAAHILQAILKGQANTKTVILQAALKVATTQTYTLDAILQSKANSRSYTIDAALKTTGSATYILQSSLFNAAGQIAEVPLKGEIVTVSQLNGAVLQDINVVGNLITIISLKGEV